METTVSTAYKHAFVMKESDIKKLWKLLEKHIGKVTASVKCSDDMERRFDLLEELISYQNPPTKRIISLSISSYSTDREKSAFIQSSDSERWGRINISINAEEKISAEIKDGIFDILAGTKPWYSFFARRSFCFPVFFAICTYLGLLLVRQRLTEEPLPHDFSPFVTIAMLIILTWGIAGAIEKLRLSLFPLQYFALGQGEKRYTNAELGRRIAVGLLASILAPLLASLVW